MADNNKLAMAGDILGGIGGVGTALVGAYNNVSPVKSTEPYTAGAYTAGGFDYKQGSMADLSNQYTNSRKGIQYITGKDLYNPSKGTRWGQLFGSGMSAYGATQNLQSTIGSYAGNKPQKPKENLVVKGKSRFYGGKDFSTPDINLGFQPQKPTNTFSQFNQPTTLGQKNWTLAKGGKMNKSDIHINPRNEGAFTRAAQRAGMSVQQFANHVLANKDKYSAAMVKRANFARNASQWDHHRYDYGGWEKGAGFKQNLGNAWRGNGTYFDSGWGTAAQQGVNLAMAGVGMALNQAGHKAQERKAASAARRVNTLNDIALARNQHNFNVALNDSKDNNARLGLLNMMADGGPVSNYFDNGVDIIKEGGTHEENPNEGVPYGVADDGGENLVEEGEVVYNDYVYSNRIKVPIEVAKSIGLHWSKNMTFADAAKQVQKESEERPNDPISKRGLDEGMQALADAQENVKAAQEAAQMKREIAKMSPEEIQQLQQLVAAGMLAQQQPQQMTPEQAAMMQQQMQQQQMSPEEAAMMQQQQQQQLSPEELQTMQQQQMQQGQAEGGYSPEELAMMQQQGQYAMGGYIHRYGDGGNTESVPEDSYSMFLKTLISDPNDPDSLLAANYIYGTNYRNPKSTGTIPADFDYSTATVQDLEKNKAYQDTDKLLDKYAELYDKDYTELNANEKRFLKEMSSILKNVDEQGVIKSGKVYQHFLDTDENGVVKTDKNGNVRFLSTAPTSGDYEGKTGRQIHDAYRKDQKYGPNHYVIQFDDDGHLQLTTKLKPPTYSKKNSPNLGEVTQTPTGPMQSRSNLPTWQRYVPLAIAGLRALNPERPDYSEADAIMRIPGQYQRSFFNPVGDYLQYRPVDTQTYINAMQQASAAAAANAYNNAGGNAAAAQAAAFLQNRQYVNALSEMMKNAEQLNTAQRQEVYKANAATNQYNSTGSMDNSQKNAAQFNQIYGTAIPAAMEMHNAERIRAREYNRQNISDLASGFGYIGKQNFGINQNQAGHYIQNRDGSYSFVPNEYFNQSQEEEQ